jgi:gag-polypeptide of LTR copia-type/Zinc knuckle
MVEDGYKPVELNDKNWVDWSRKIEARLRIKGVWKMISITSEVIDEMSAAAKKQTERDEEICYGEIMQAIGSKQAIYVAKCSKAREVWNKLLEHFESKKPLRQFELAKQLNELCYAGGPIDEYLSSSAKLYYDLVATGSSMSEQEAAHSILSGLPSHFTMYVTMLFDSPEATTRTLEDTMEKVILYSDRLSKDDKKPEEYALFAKHRHHQGIGEQRTCHNCGKVGHLQRDCKAASRDGRSKKKEYVDFHRALLAGGLDDLASQFKQKVNVDDSSNRMIAM